MSFGRRQSDWDPFATIESLHGKDFRFERALLVVRGDPLDNVRNIRTIVEETLGVHQFQETTAPKDFDFERGARFLADAPSLLLMEAPRTKRFHTPGGLIEDVRGHLLRLKVPSSAWHHSLPLVVSNRDWAYRRREVDSGLYDVDYPNGFRDLLTEIESVRAVALSTRDATREEDLRNSLASLYEAPLSKKLTLPMTPLDL